MRGMPVEKLSVTGTGAETEFTATADEMQSDRVSADTGDSLGKLLFHIDIISRDKVCNKGYIGCYSSPCGANKDID